MAVNSPGDEGSGDGASARSEPGARSTSRNELTRAPRLTRRAQVAVVGFGLLLIASLLIPALAAVEMMPGFSLLSAGLMVLLGFAELMDARQGRFIVVVRCGGWAMMLLGFAVQIL